MILLQLKIKKDILNNIDDEREINTSESMGTVSPCIILIGAKQTAQHIMRNISILRKEDSIWISIIALM